MQKITTLTILLLTTFGALAQKGTKSLGLTFSGDYTRSVYSGGSSGFQQYTDDINGKFGFTAGINASFQRRNKGAFDIGLLYMQHHENTSYEIFFYPSGGSYRLDYYAHIVSIPLNWLFYVNEGKTRVYASIGIAPSYYVAGTVDYDIKNNGVSFLSGRETQYAELDFDYLFLAGTASVGVSQYLSEQFELRLAPTFRIMTNISNLGEDVKVFPYFIGVNAGIYYKFNSKSPESRPH